MSGSTRDVITASGTPPLVRRLGPIDRSACLAHLLRLEPETRRQRFCGALGDEAVAAIVEDAFRASGLMLARRVLVGAMAGRDMVALADLAIDGREAEAAFSVEAPWRQRGLGGTLFARALLYAQNRGVRRVHVRCLVHNRAMCALARRLGLALVFEEGEIQGTIAVPPANPLSLLAERAGDTLALTRAMMGMVGRIDPFAPPRGT